MGRMSISINSTHDDPVGFNIDLNSAASQVGLALHCDFAFSASHWRH